MRERLGEILWAALLISLPVTSFPFFPGGVGGATLVRPLAVYPLLLLLPIVILPRLWKASLPRPAQPLLAFAVVATGSTLLALVSLQAGVRGVSVQARALRSLATLGLGLALYFTVVLYLRDEAALRRSLRWLYLGMALTLAWGSLQAVYILHFNQDYFDLLGKIQRFISTRPLFERRVSGMTFEPNWFAEQIVFLWMPWLLAAALTRRSAFRWRWGGLMVEHLLIVWGAAVTLFTFSRLGLAALGGLAVLAAGMAIPWGKARRLKGRRLLLWGTGVFLSGALALGLVFTLGQRNQYFSRLWRYWTNPEERGGQSYLEFIAFGQRMTYWETAYRMYADAPWLGVGLGNYAFHFGEYLPYRSWHRQPEIVRQLTPLEGNIRLITPKNLYLRLLAETGLLGTTFFAVFVLLLARQAVHLRSIGGEARFWGTGGLLGLAVFAFASLSYDSLALPNMWVLFGLLSAESLQVGKVGKRMVRRATTNGLTTQSPNYPTN